MLLYAVLALTAGRDEGSGEGLGSATLDFLDKAGSRKGKSHKPLHSFE